VVLGRVVFEPSTYKPHLVVCPRCSREVKPSSVHAHLDSHDDTSERKAMRAAGVGSWVKPLPGQLDLFGGR
jgi:hypothetical protein